MKADLHNHTIYSDGILTPFELSKYAKEKKLDLIAITDHDSTNAFKEENNYSVPIIKGVELSTFHDGENIHLLGYFINNYIPEELNKLLNTFAEKRKARIYKIITKLKEYYNIELEYDEIAKYADGTIGRVHVAKAICEKYGGTIDDAFDNYIGNKQKAYVKTQNFAYEDAIATLHKNNAIAVLAHPVLIKENNIEELIKYGIDGIEVYHSKHSKENTEEYLEYAKKYNLLITGGSDFHYYPEKTTDADLGKATISGEDLEKFLNKLNLKIEE